MKNKYLSKIKKLNKVQFEVTQNKGTEKAFANQYWNHKEYGIYVDIISDEPLFSSFDKFDSGCGWPSFTKSLDQSEIILQDDLSHGMRRTEVLTKTCHLGHFYSERGIRKILMNYTKSAGMDRSISPHKLRHFLFTWMKKQGVDDALIQHYSGHDSRKSLEIYSKLSITDAQNEYNKIINNFPV